MREDLLREVLVPVDAVHDLQRAVGPEVVAAVLYPPHERARLGGVPEPDQRVQREGRVADPGVAVVPVALAAELLREAARGRGDERSEPVRHEQLENQG